MGSNHVGRATRARLSAAFCLACAAALGACATDPGDRPIYEDDYQSRYGSADEDRPARKARPPKRPSQRAYAKHRRQSAPAVAVSPRAAGLRDTLPKRVAHTPPAPAPAASAGPLKPVTCPAALIDCKTGVDELLADRDRSWIRQPAGASDYVAGSRLVALVRVAGTLSCTDLRSALDEAQTGVVALGAAIEDERSLGRNVDRLSAAQGVATGARDSIRAETAKRCG